MFQISNNNTINGFEFKDTHKEIKYLQYEDDIALTLKNTSPLKRAFQTVELFCCQAGSEINSNISQCILMGNLKDKHVIKEGVKVTNSAVRCLGIHLGHDKTKYNELNWMKTYNDMEKLFESWKKKLTLIVCC